MPRVFDSIEEKQYDTARKVMLKNFSEAVRLIAMNTDIRSANNAEDFVENYLRKELKILKTCKNENLRECGIETGTNKIFSVGDTRVTMPTSINDLAPTISNGTYIEPSEKSYGFVMVNGYSVNLFYNKNCIGKDKSLTSFYFQDRMCINAIYDINGLGLPNQVGRDIGFITLFYPSSIEMRTVAPNFYKSNSGNANFYTASSMCAKLGDEYRVPDNEELGAMYFNSSFLSIEHSSYISSTSADADNGWAIQSRNGVITHYAKTRNARLRCVK